MGVERKSISGDWTSESSHKETLAELVEKRLCVLEVGGIEAFGRTCFLSAISVSFCLVSVSCPAEILVGLLTLQDRLPQGAPTSPAIADLVLRPVDEQVHAAAQRLGVRVTRYVDDFAFSGPSRDGLLKLRAVIRERRYPLPAEAPR